MTKLVDVVYSTYVTRVKLFFLQNLVSLAYYYYYYYYYGNAQFVLAKNGFYIFWYLVLGKTKVYENIL